MSSIRHVRKSLDDRAAHARDFAYTLALFWTRIEYVPETTYIRVTTLATIHGIDNNVRNIIRDVRKKELY